LALESQDHPLALALRWIRWFQDCLPALVLQVLPQLQVGLLIHPFRQLLDFPQGQEAQVGLSALGLASRLRRHQRSR
jgi:hypothetical protein